jgi:excisionase family DNA binding protein
MTSHPPRNLSKLKSHDQSAERPRAMFTVKELAAAWKRSERTIRRLIKSGELRAHRIGSAVLIAEDDADVFLARNRIR